MIEAMLNQTGASVKSRARTNNVTNYTGIC